MAISDLNPNIAEERARPRKTAMPLPTRPIKGTLFSLEVPLRGARPLRCTLRAPSLADAIDQVLAVHPNARPDRIREIPPLRS